MFVIGQHIGPYVLVRKLGRGGFGEVWLAERRSKFVTTRVALKLPLDAQGGTVTEVRVQHEGQVENRDLGQVVLELRDP